MATYLTELLTNLAYGLGITLFTFLISYAIYFLNKNKYKSFTLFLDNKKVFFDIILVVFLTSMSISIAIDANSIATNANQIAENQLQIQKAANQPIFTFEPIKYDNSTSHRIIISNEGTPFNCIIEISSITYLNVFSYDSGHSEGVIIPIDNYYHENSKINEEDTHKIYEISDSGNWDIILKLLGDMKEVETREDCSINVGWYEFIQIEYGDIYGETHENVYMVNDWYHHKLSDVEAEELYELLAASPYSLRMDELNAEKVYEIFKAETNGSPQH